MDLLRTNSAESRIAGRSTSKKAFSLVEILIAMVIFSIFTTGVIILSMSTLERDDKAVIKNESLLYTQECLEAVRNIKDRDYLDLVSGQYGLSFASDTWSFITAPEIIDDFYSRTVTIEDVYRDEDGNIAETGTLDPETKYVTCDVTWDWKGILPQMETLSAYMTNWRGYDWVQTLCTEFDAGIFSSTETVDTVSPPEGNCATGLELVETITSFFSSVDVGDHGNDVVVSGDYAYMAGAKTNQGLTVADISDKLHPVVEEQLNVQGKGRYITKDGNYVYMGIESWSKGLAIVNVTDPTNPSLVKSFNVGSYGNQLAVSGNYLFMGIESLWNSFKVIDITNKSSPSIVTSLNFGANTNVIHLDGNYAYVGTDGGWWWWWGGWGGQFKVIDISTPTSPSVVGSLNVGDEILSIEINGTVAYVGTSDDDHSLKVINISDPENPSLITTISTDNQIQDMVVSGDYLYTAIDEVNPGMEVFNITNPFSPYWVYSVDITGKGTGAYSDDEYVYLTTDVNNRGLVVKEAITPSYAGNGTYISDELDTGSEQTRYNFIDWNYTDTVGGTVKLQIRTADTVAHLSTATWVGSNGTASTYYETPRTNITLSPSATGKRYVQFQIIMTSDTIETPLVESVNINYNP